MSKKFYYLIYFIFSFSHPISLAAKSWNTHLGVSAIYRNYSEKTSTPDFKSDEYGVIPGIYAGLELNKPNSLYLNLSLHLYPGSTVYDGGSYTQNFTSSTPLKARTFNLIARTQIDLGYNFTSGEEQEILFFSLGRYLWDRDINNNTVEIYEWGFIGIGIKYLYQLNSDWQINPEFSAIQMLNGVMQLYPHPDLFHLGNERHYMVKIPFTYHMKRNFLNIKSFTIEPYYRFQAIGKSNTVIVNNIYAYEPASITHIIGLTTYFSF